MKRVPLWRLLVDRGLAPDRKSATAWALSGRVYVAGERADKAGVGYDPAAPVNIAGLDARFVGRGGLKLEGALADLGVDPRGAVGLDAGASTGGFTDCLLQHGAARVYAVDVGYGQITGSLRADPRVVCLERTNISDLIPGALDPRPDLATLDLSYLSLRTAIPIVAPLLRPSGELLCLVKPLFETTDALARRTGVIDDPTEYHRILEDLVAWCAGAGHSVRGVSASRITGSGGTTEFFLRVCATGSHPGTVTSGLTAAIEAAVGRALGLPDQNRSS